MTVKNALARDLMDSDRTRAFFKRIFPLKKGTGSRLGVSGSTGLK